MDHPKPEQIDHLWSDKYWASFRLNVHQLLAWGYQDAKSKIEQDHEEQEITGFIAEAIQNRLRSPACPRWCRQYVLKEDNPVFGEGRTGKRRKRPDLIFESTAKSRPEYIFEAKRLRKHKKYRQDYYLGEEGLQRFLRGEYAPRYLEAGMLGYVQYDTLDVWINRLKVAIDTDIGCTCKLLLISPQHDVQIIDAFPKEWVSKHKRHTGKDIAIYHILLDCCL